MKKSDDRSTARKAYSHPRLVVYGDVRHLTRGSSTGNRLDQFFPVGTPYGDVTFSGPGDC